ncbi:polymorphic toxin-type HINT domain-containing protein [Streptomyces sp. NBC_01465]|uniref:polymorphic toxin-type HINT domain-containing protein n=1 Tax=Streptomyces sp. NBC_01465 TaxID=2903878 RepID=UPI002E33AA4B|nr:polymorphic toxin-type HINT domain-containing protein [Streptomyces sp. NBC_01465]
MAAKTATRIRRRIALSVSTVLIGALLQATVAESAQASTLAKVPASEKPLTGHGVQMKPRPADSEPRVPAKAPKHTWAKAGSATVTLTPSAKSPAAAGSLPIALTVPKTQGKTPSTKGATADRTPLSGKTTVRVLDETTAKHAGIDGLLFTLQPQQGAAGNAVGVKVDYSAFAQAYGGSYAARLKLVRLPACAATSPGSKNCTSATPVATDNDTTTHTLTASALPVATSPSVAAAPMVLAATTGTSSASGDYTASQLSASSAWDTNLNTGDFSWSYDMPVPGVPGKLAPKVGLSYSSGGIDGRTANSNNQSSWAGDGFNLWPGSIERAYKPCADDGIKNADGSKPGDVCWAYDNASLSFNGHSGELISTGKDTFKIKGDDGTKVDRIYGSSTDVRSNGAHNDEYWRVTTTDGTRYYFGYNKLEGWASGNETTDSTWTVPVYGDDTDEPCHAATFADSWCQQAWKWNLDYAVDVHGNAIAYYYDKETNYYARNLKPADETVYDRGGSLDRIEYGLKSSSVYTAKALAMVDFTSSERCLPETGVTCDASTIEDKSFYWYDTPWDLNCKSGVDCTKSYSPSFWTRKRLTDVTTEVLQPAGTYTPVDSWTLTHRWGMADIDYQLLLASIQHTGKSASPNVPLPKVTFGYDQRANRLDTHEDDTSPFIKERLSTIADESGGQTDVTYSAATCDAANLPTPQTNTTRCFPVYYTKAGHEDPTLQWFNKYVVDAVTQTDRTKSSPDMVTRYSYLDGAAWHFDDDDGLSKEKYKTWSSWRGYAHVRVQTGGQDPVGMKSQTDHYYLRGMDGDRASLVSDPKPVTKSVTVSDDNGGTITDHDSAAGYEYKSESYSGPGGKILSKTVSTPWHYETAKRVRSWGTTTANLTGTQHTYAWMSLDDGAGSKWRQTYVSYTHENTAGRVIVQNDAGDTSTATDNQCTRTTYADNATDWILNKPSRIETVAVACADTPDRTKDVLSDVRTAYDGQAYGAAPTKGEVSNTATLKSHNGTTATYLESGTTYDSYGRPLTVTDITGTVTATEDTAPVRTKRSDGRTTTTVYTPATGFPTTTKVTGAPATAGDATTAQSTTTTYDTLRGLPTVALDTNNKRTETTYDALGRNLKVWLPNRSKANNDTPNYEYTYSITDSSPVAVGTKTLKNDGSQRTSYTLFDGFLRQRQTQQPGPDGGRLITDTFLDERGLDVKDFAPYYNTDAPSTTLLALDDALNVETQTWNSYDGLGRAIKTQQVAGNGDGGQVLSTTLTSYLGDRTSVTPPQGATPTTTVTDARGNTTDLLQYHGTTPTGAADTTHYDYWPSGKVAKLTDAAGNVWSYGYDQSGNQTSTHDPDKGDSTSHFDDRNQLIYTVDSRSKTITHIYDGLGRETESHDGDASGPLLTKHVWDPTGFKGQLATATRYVGGATGDAYTTTYSLYDTLYRPNRTTVTIPASEGGLAGSYQSNTKYNLDGTTQSASYPAAGSLTSEVITPTYDDVMRTKKLTGTGGATYLTDAIYSLTGKPLQYSYQALGAKKAQVTNTYQWGTQRLSNSSVNREDVAGTDKSATYSYNEAGTITSIADVSRDGTDNQCYTYDYLGRLTEAWAQPTTTCASTPSGTVLGGPAPYWQSFGYDLTGNRTAETDHDAGGDSTKDVKHSYVYPPSKAAHPHALSEVDTTGPTGISADKYHYDFAGNTDTRTIAGDQQTLLWDDEGHLAKVTQPDGSGGTKTTSYVYGADDNRLLRRTDSATTLYLGTTELTLTKGATTPTATRYYDLGGGNQAIRTDDNKLSFLLGDQNGTAQLAVNSTDLTMQQRRSTPFGTARGKSPTNWPGEHGYVGGTIDDTTGLTQLGARTYDTNTGRFLSADPVMDLGAPQQINGYSYSNSSPISYADPTGLYYCRNGRSDNCDVHGNARGNGAWCPSAADPYCKPGVKHGYQMGKNSEPTEKQKKKEKKLYDYFFTKNQCYGNPVSANPKYDVCYTQAEIDADKQMGKELLSAIGDMTLIVPDIRCKMGNDAECDVEGEAISTFDVGGVEIGSVRFLGALTKAARAICSFTPSTKVLMKGGGKKSISEIKPGDEVESADPTSGRHRGARTVTARLVHHDSDLIDLAIGGKNDRVKTLHTTSNHPFWDETIHAWVPAAELIPGHALKVESGPGATLLGAVVRTGSADMYNLTVEQLHTYYVLTGETPVLVHNACGSSNLRIAVGKGASRDYQMSTTGMIEVRLHGGGEKIWADGVDGDSILDAKFVSGKSSPFVPPGIKNAKVQGFIDADIENEMRRYAAVIGDGENRYTNLRIITNTSAAVPYFEGMMSKYGVPGAVSVVQ